MIFKMVSKRKFLLNGCVLLSKMIWINLLIIIIFSIMITPYGQKSKNFRNKYRYRYRLNNTFNFSVLPSPTSGFTVKDDYEFATTEVDKEVKQKQCSDWMIECERFRDFSEKNKGCYGSKMFLYADFKADRNTASGFCKEMFNYTQADLLYFDLNYDEDDLSTEIIDKDLNNFIEYKLDNALQFYDQLPTSAICCPILINRQNLFDKFDNDPNERIFDSRFVCRWSHNQKEIPEKYYEHLDLDKEDCSFLVASFSKKEKQFSRAESIKSEKVFSFMCTYELPDICKHITPTSTTPRPTPKPSTTTRHHTRHTIKHTTKHTRKPTTTTSTTTPKPTTIDPKITHCEAMTTNDYVIKYWPEAAVGHYSEPGCPNGTRGNAKWLCDDDGHFDPQGPIITCSLEWIDKISNKINKTKDMKQLHDQVNDFESKIKKEPAKFPDDLKKIIDTIEKIGTKFETFASNETIISNQDQVKNVTKDVVGICSKMIESDEAWMQTKTKDRQRIAGKMLNYIQNNVITMSCYAMVRSNETIKHNLVTSTSNIYLSSFNMDYNQPVIFEHGEHWFKILKPLKTNQTVSEWCPHRMGIGALFKKLSTYMFVEKLQKNTTGQNIKEIVDESNVRMNSEIIAFSYNNITRRTFKLPNGNNAKMNLLHHQLMNFGAKARCVYWDFQTEQWSSEGCWIDLQQSTRNHTTCVCNHLTNFAVLLDVSGEERPSTIKSVLTIVLCTCSIICLLLTIIFFILCRELRSRRSSIIINISLMMILVDFLVIFGLDRTEVPVICKSVSIMLLYAMLAMFFWMLMEGYNLYQMMILIFNTKGRLRMLYLYIIGYGLPALITISAAVYMQLKTELTNEYFCWITSTKYPNQIWIVAAPITIIIIINTIIMFRVMRIVLMKNAKNFHASASRSSSSGYTSSSSISKISVSKRKSNSNGTKQRTITAKKSISISSGVDERITNGLTNEKSLSNFEERIQEIISYLKGFFGLIALMGITWLTYLLYIHQFGHYFSYIFIILNGLQGVFIFITQFIFNKKALKAVKKRLYRLVGLDDFYSHSSSATNSRPSTTSSSTNQHFKYLANKQQPEPPQNFIMEESGENYGSNNALIDRSTSLEFF